MPRAQLARRYQRNYFGRKRQQAERIRYGGTGFADTFGELFLRKMIFVHELLHRIRRFDRIQVFPLQVFDERNFFDLAVGIRSYNHGDLPLARNFSGAVTIM